MVVHHKNGDIIQEYTYFLLGFVPADVIRLKNNVLFSKLIDAQITFVEKFFESN